MKQQEQHQLHRRQVSPKQRSKTFWAATILCIFFAVVIAWQGYNYMQLFQEQRRLQQQIEELQKKNAELEQEKDKLQTPQEVEGVARNELGLVKPGEVPYVK